MVDDIKLGMGRLTFWGYNPAIMLTDLLPALKKEDMDKSEGSVDSTERPKGSTEDMESSNESADVTERSTGSTGNTEVAMSEGSRKGQNGGSESEETPFNVLLVGQCDARHVLKTWASRTPSNTELNVFICETHPALYTRQLLLLYLAAMPLEKVGLHEKTLQFMEIFGNLTCRPQTREAIRKMCPELVKCICDENLMKKEIPALTVTGMRNKDREGIVATLDYWTKSKVTATEIQRYWDNRLRKYLATRYDSRIGAFDWDYNMKVIDKNKEAKIIHSSEFKFWRNFGNAFCEYESDYSQANVTLLTPDEPRFGGDVLVGPFIPYGLIVPDSTGFYAMGNDQYKKKSYDLTYKNVHDMLEAITPRRNEHTEGVATFKIHFVPLDTCENGWKRSILLKTFDLVYISCMTGHKVRPELSRLAKDGGRMVVEKSRFLHYFRKENDEAYEKKVLDLAMNASWVQHTKLDDKEQEVIRDFMIFHKETAELL